MPTVEGAVRRARREVKMASRKPRARKLGIRTAPPNYIFLPIAPGSTVIDVGCSHEAELAQYFIANSDARAFGVDPTRKHAPALQAIEQRTGGRFTHMPVAVTATPGTLMFYESLQNESGSILESHRNVIRDDVRSYEVQAVTLADLVQMAEVDDVAYLKLDLEGAEYDVLARATANDLAPFRQVFVEFHHHAIPERSEHDTRRRVDAVEAMGLRSFSFDDHNVLFYR